MFTISPVAETTIFATYKRQQTMLERQRRLNFLPEILFQATTKCDNSIAGPSKKTWGFGWGRFKNDDKRYESNVI